LSAQVPIEGYIEHAHKTHRFVGGLTFRKNANFLAVLEACIVKCNAKEITTTKAAKMFLVNHP